jgi:RNA polymerase sigma-70 factor (ECF subfamily)
MDHGQPVKQFESGSSAVAFTGIIETTRMRPSLSGPRPAHPAPPDAEATAELVRRAQRGEVEAFEGLYRAHVGRVHAVCRRMAGDPAHAEELTQDVFVRAWERLGSFLGDAAFGSWLHRLAVNVVLEDARGERRRSARVAVMAVPPETAAGGAGALDARMDLDRALAALPPGARTVFVLHDMEGYSHGEIAALTGLAEGTLRAQLHRARRLLMEALER